MTARLPLSHFTPVPARHLYGTYKLPVLLSASVFAEYAGLTHGGIEIPMAPGGAPRGGWAGALRAAKRAGVPTVVSVACKLAHIKAVAENALTGLESMGHTAPVALVAHVPWPAPADLDTLESGLLDAWSMGLSGIVLPAPHAVDPAQEPAALALAQRASEHGHAVELSGAAADIDRVAAAWRSEGIEVSAVHATCGTPALPVTPWERGQPAPRGRAVIPAGTVDSALAEAQAHMDTTALIRARDAYGQTAALHATLSQAAGGA